MSIKQAIVHIFSKKENVFHTIHPETEVGMITDFETGLLQKLALTSTIKAVTALQTNSWFGQLLKMMLNASGVKYNIAQNGYICFGSFFGDLIIQWGYVNAGKLSKPWKFYYPVAFTNGMFGASIIRLGGENAFSEIITESTVEYLIWRDCDYKNESGNGDGVKIIVLGK